MRRSLFLAAVLVAGTARAAVTIQVAPGDPGGLEGARDRARLALRAGHGPVTILLAAGTYVLDHPLALTASDSGTLRHPVSWQAAPGALVRLSGGRTITGWMPATDPAVLARLVPAVRGKVLVADLRAQGIADFGTLRRRGFGLPRAASALELVCDDRIMTLARHPTTGWLTVTATVTGGARERFTFTDAAAVRWSPGPDLWVHGYWTFEWADTHDPVTAFDPARHAVEIAKPQSWYGVAPGTRFAFENAPEALDDAGEYWVDRGAGRLYCLPPAGGPPARSVVTLLEAPLVTLDGASDVDMEGLVLEDARGDGLRIRGGARCRIRGCAFRNLGGLGVEVTGGRGHLIRSCDIHDTGEGAIILEGGDRATLASCGHAAENNHLYRYCRWSRTYRAGVQVDGVGCRVAHNWIHDAPHNAILLGGNDHVVEYNRIERVCLDTGDAGAFYTGRDPTMRGTVVRYNIFRDLHRSQGRPGEFNEVMAVYLDDCACGIRVEGNLFERAGMGVLVGGGRDNEVLGNVFVACDPAVLVDARARSWGAEHFRAGGDWEIDRKLAAVPFNSARWRAHYPALAGYRIETSATPTGTRIIGNTCAGGPWLHLNDGLTERDLTVRDNRVLAAVPAGGAAWPGIPVDRIGLEPDRFRAALPADPSRP